MSNFKRIAIVLLIVVAVMLVAGSFKSSDVLDRAIILGMGVDAEENGGVVLTCEVVSPGNGTEQVGTFSKMVTVKGETINIAIQNIAEVTGKEASLGQCVVLVLGQEYVETVDFSDLTEYFVNHHSFKESAVICCCEGSAKDLFNRGNALTQSMSIAISTALLDGAQKIAVSSNSLLEFARSQNELDCTGFLNKVTFVPSENTDSQLPDKEMGFIGYRELCVFRANKYVTTLSEQQVKGMSLFLPELYGETFVSFEDDVTRTVQVTKKDVKIQPNDAGGFDIALNIYVRYGRTDSEAVGGSLSAKNDKEIPQRILDDVTEQARNVAKTYLDAQTEYNFDLLQFHEAYRRKQGTSQALAEKPMKDFPVNLTVTVQE